MKCSGTFLLTACALGLSGACETRPEDQAELIAQELGECMLQPLPNRDGLHQTATATGAIDTGNPFFASLGTNGRSCGTCHLASQGWTITPSFVRARFEASGGLDPLFRAHDGANAPGLNVSTVEARRQAY